MQGKQAKIVSPTQERAMLGYLATTRSFGQKIQTYYFCSAYRSSLSEEKIVQAHADMQASDLMDKPRHGFLYIYAECSRLCPESSPKALLESRTEG
jgi:hypothetical protein